MSKTKYDIIQDLYELTKMSLRLDHYITDEHIFVTLHGANMPTMSLGTFLMRLRRLTALQSRLEIGSRAQLQIAIQTHNNALTEWKQHYK